MLYIVTFLLIGKSIKVRSFGHFASFIWLERAHDLICAGNGLVEWFPDLLWLVHKRVFVADLYSLDYLLFLDGLFVRMC